MHVTGDTGIEPNEYFFVDVLAATNGTVARGRALGVIKDDDPPDLLFRDGFDWDPF